MIATVGLLATTDTGPLFLLNLGSGAGLLVASIIDFLYRSTHPMFLRLGVPGNTASGCHAMIELHKAFLQMPQ